MSGSNTQQELYAELAHALALLVYCRCCAFENADAEYEHFNDNGLGVPPDILARLGIMEPVNPNDWLSSGRHVFLHGWTPDKPLKLKRHKGEPSIFDLIVATCLMVDWDRRVSDDYRKVGSPALGQLPTIDITNDRRFQAKNQIVFHYMAYRQAAACLEKLGLGEWADDGGFQVIHAIATDTPVDLIDSYDETRALIAKRLGGLRSLFPA